MRKELESGAKVILNNRIYTIESVRGFGGSCIVYNASNTDNVRVLLKECYPHGTEVHRNKDNSLIWNDETIQNSVMLNFKNTHKKLIEIYNQFPSSSSFPMEFGEFNNTVYCCTSISSGKTFENDDSNYLPHILKTVIATAKIIDKYHEKGYLHLDIKAENIQVVDETRELVILFDVDSVVSIEDVRNNRLKYIPYSPQLSSPEQEKGDISKIDERSDIYSIGAMLFQKILSRNIEYFDRELFADWDLDDLEIFEYVNPKLKRLIKNIFRGTLSNNIKRRYSSTKILIEVLNEALEVSEEKVYLSSDDIIPTKDFVGREETINEIYEGFLNYNNIFLSGIGGIGKTELAKKYAERYKNQYDTIIFCKYASDLKDALRCIYIHGFDADNKSFDTREEMLKKLLDKKTLLILDNFDVQKDDYLSDFLKINCKKLITTRNDFSKYKNALQINISEMDYNELKTLFKKDYTFEWGDEEEWYFEKILNKIDRLTLCVPILAMQCKESGINVETLYFKIANGLDELKNSEDVYMYKDDYTIEDTVPRIMRVIFNISNLTEEEQKVLRNLFVLKFMYVTKEEYREIALYGSVDKNLNTFNQMIKSNWIKVIQGKTPDTTYYELHPIINDLVKNDLVPIPQNCPEVFQYIDNYTCIYHEESNLPRPCRNWWDENENVINSRKIGFIAAFIRAVIESIDITNLENFKFVTHLITRHIERKRKYNMCEIEIYEKPWNIEPIADIVLSYLDKNIFTIDDIYLFIEFIRLFTYVFDGTIWIGDIYLEEKIAFLIKGVLQCCFKEFEKGSINKDIFSDIYNSSIKALNMIIDDFIWVIGVEVSILKEEEHIIFRNDCINDDFILLMYEYKKYVIDLNEETFDAFDNIMKKYLNLDMKLLIQKSNEPQNDDEICAYGRIRNFISTVDEDEEYDEECEVYEDGEPGTVLNDEEMEFLEDLYKEQILFKQEESDPVKIINHFSDDILKKALCKFILDSDKYSAAFHAMLCMFFEDNKNCSCNDDCIDSIFQLFQLADDENEIGNNALASLYCGNNEKFNDYMEMILKKIINKLEKIDYTNLTHENYPLIYIEELEDIKSTSGYWLEAWEREEKFFPFEHNIISFIEDNFKNMIGYEEMIFMCYEGMLSINRYRDGEKARYGKNKIIYDEYERKIEKMLNIKQLRSNTNRW